MIQLSNPLEDRICQASSCEAVVFEALVQLQKTGPRPLTNGLPEWEEKSRLVFYKGRLYIPKDNDLRRNVICQCHDAPTSGHPGINGTYERLDQHYWWPNMRAFAKKYVEGCEVCAH